jgi:CRISPR-associated protein Csm2
MSKERGIEMLEVSFYQDTQKKFIRPELFSRTAEELAKSFAGKGKHNKRSQIRKFYDELLRLNTLANNGNEEWGNILPYVHMLIAKATYAEGRDLVTGDFVDFLRKCIDQVQSHKDLDVFASFFEAFMGFYRKYQKD